MLTRCSTFLCLIIKVIIRTTPRFCNKTRTHLWLSREVWRHDSRPWRWRPRWWRPTNWLSECRRSRASWKLTPTLITKFYIGIATIHWNKALLLPKNSHLTGKSQSAKHSNIEIKYVCDIGSWLLAVFPWLLSLRILATSTWTDKETYHPSSTGNSIKYCRVETVFKITQCWVQPSLLLDISLIIKHHFTWGIISCLWSGSGR